MLKDRRSVCWYAVVIGSGDSQPQSRQQKPATSEPKKQAAPLSLAPVPGASPQGDPRALHARLPHAAF